MKAAVTWGAIFVVLVGFAWIVDKGAKHVGIPDYLWLPINLTVFMFLLYRFVGKPMGKFLDSRGEGIAQELEQAQQKLAEAEDLRAQVVQRLADVETEVAGMHERAEREGNAEAERIREQTQRDQERFLKRVDDEIARRQAETRHQLARETAELTAQLTRELLSREMTDEDRRRVLDRSLAAVRALHDKE